MSKETSRILQKNGQPFEYVSSSDIQQAGYVTNSMMDAMSVTQLVSSLEMPMRTRLQLYDQYMYMLSDPICHTAINLHVTQALGGHETNGDVVFIDKKADISSVEDKMIDDINKFVTPLLNRNVYRLAYQGAAMGDSYARIYSVPKTGVNHIDCNEFYLPAKVQAFEQAGNTVGFQIAIKERTLEPLNLGQMARFKMPRMTFVPQLRFQMNAWHEVVTEDDFRKQPILPALVGGSLLEPAEKPYFLLQSALLSLNSSRILDSIRESIVGLNMQDMTKEQQTQFVETFKKMISTTKARAAKAIEEKKPIVEKILHLVPTWREKQLYSIDAGGSLAGSNANVYNIDDVMLYAKLLAGAFGLDLSMLGFSDLLSGGLGDGGFFRVSAQSAERSRTIRMAITDFINAVIDVHCYQKYGGTFYDGERPYEVNFIGSSTAYAREQQDVRERKAAVSGGVLQAMQQLKELNFTREAAKLFLMNEMDFDERDAEKYTESFPVTIPEGEAGQDNFSDERV